MSRRDGTTTKVFVGGLPAEATAEGLLKLFAPYGKIVECDIANRCGFIHLEDKELAEKSIEDLNNTNFMGGRISVEKGRVKAITPSRRERVGGRGPGKDRGRPYSREDDYGRAPRNGSYDGAGRDYGFDRYADYERAMGPPGRGYERDYDIYADRRPAFDDRSRDYLDDRRGYAPNGYGRSYEPRASGYDDRRPYVDAHEDRRPSLDHRPPLDSMGSRSLGSSYDRSAPPNDMYSRRAEPSSKAVSSYGDRNSGYGDRNSGYGSYGTSGVAGDSYGASGGYGTSSSLGYGGSSAAYGGGGGGGGAYSTSYDGGMQSNAQGGMGGNYSGSGGATYGNGGGNYGAGGYSSGTTAYGSGTGAYNSGGAGGYGSTTTSYPSGGGGGYSNSQSGYGNSPSTGYGTTPADSYGSLGGQGGYGDSYGAPRGSYDNPYSSQGRSLTSGGGVRDRERDMRRSVPSGPDHRY